MTGLSPASRASSARSMAALMACATSGAALLSSFRFTSKSREKVSRPDETRTRDLRHAKALQAFQMCPSACSGSIFGNGQMLVMRATKAPTDPLGEFIRSQQTVGLYNLSLAMNPFGLYGVQPRTLLGKQATHDPHSAPALLNFSVVPSQPSPDLPGDLPTGVVPDENHDLLAHSLELLQAPLEKLGRYGANGPAVNESQPRIAEFG